MPGPRFRYIYFYICTTICTYAVYICHPSYLFVYLWWGLDHDGPGSYLLEWLASESISGERQGVWSEGEYAPRFAYYAQATHSARAPGIVVPPQSYGG